MLLYPTLNQEQLSLLAVKVCMNLNPDNVSVYVRVYVCVCGVCCVFVVCVCERENACMEHDNMGHFNLYFLLSDLFH